MHLFDTQTQIERRSGGDEDGVYEAALTGDWNIGDNPNGGYMVTLAVRAMLDLVPHPDPLSVTTHFLRPGVAGAAAEIRAQLVRTGRSLSTARATLVQDGKARIEVLASFGDLAASVGVEQAISIPAPEVPPPGECIPRSGELQGIDLPLVDRLDILIHPDHAKLGSGERAEMAGWIRFADGRAPDPLALLLFVDAFPPSPATRLGMVGWVPTLELTTHVRRAPSPGWIRAALETTDLHKGRMVESGALWDSSGALVAQCRQLGLVMSG